MAKVFREGRIDFLSEANPNKIYEEIVNSVYRRKAWGDTEHPAFPPGEQGTFNRVLEEIGVCAWQGGRCATIAAIEQRCKGGQFERLLEFLRDRSRYPTKLLLTGFFFRRADETFSGDQSVEFTHKTFFEYLTARRIVREIEIISLNMARKREDINDGWDESDSLIHWAKLCGPTAMDKDLFQFLVNEIKLQPIEQVRQWQKDLRSLIEYMLREGMPMHLLGPGLTYKEAVRMARNSEEALLAGVSACARTTNQRYRIRWPAQTSAGEWICRLRGQRKDIDTPSCFALSLLNHIDLSHQIVSGQDLSHANLSYSVLRSADLSCANLCRANLRHAILTYTDLREADLADGDFLDADLRGAKLDGAILHSVNLYRAKLLGAEGLPDWLKS